MYHDVYGVRVFCHVSVYTLHPFISKLHCMHLRLALKGFEKAANVWMPRKSEV